MRTRALVVLPVLVALRRLRARPGSFAAVLLAAAAAGGLVGWSSVEAALSQQRHVERRLAEVPPGRRALRTVSYLVATMPDLSSGPARRTLGSFRDVTLAPQSVRVFSPVAARSGAGVRLVVPDAERRELDVAAGRRAAPCRASPCEAVALTQALPIGTTVRFPGGFALRVVGRGAVGADALPDSVRPWEAGERALLVDGEPPPLQRLLREHGSVVVRSAALRPRAVRASELQALATRLQRAVAVLEREDPATDASAPVALLEQLAERGDVARSRLLLVAGQAAALVFAFAAFAASARRRELQLLDEQLDTLGASRSQVFAVRAIEAAAPMLLGGAAALVGLRVAAQVLVGRSDLAPSFIGAALPPSTTLTIAGLAVAGSALLVAAGRREPRSGYGLGALELAALAALGVVVWQTATTGALDPDRLAGGESVSPVLLLVPGLAFFATGVLLVRLLPLGLRLGERLARRARVGVRIAFLGAACNPGRVAAATSFLAVAVGSALFSLDYRATLERQARDEARFVAGAQWRIAEHAPGRSSGSGDATPLTRYRLPTRERPTPVLRLSSSLVDPARAAGEAQAVELVGLPTGRLGEVLGWRPGFSKLSRAALAARLRPRPVSLRGPGLAHDGRSLRVWVRAVTERPRLVVVHLLQPAEQRFGFIRLGAADRRWRRLTAPVPVKWRGAEVVGVEFVPTYVPTSGIADENGYVDLGRLEQRRPGGWSALPSLERWQAAAAEDLAFQGFVTTWRLRRAPIRSSVHLDLNGTGVPLIRPPLHVPAAVPVVAGSGLAAAAVGGVVTLDLDGWKLPVRIVARSSRFPTVTERPSFFAVADYDTLFAALNLDRPGAAVPSEAWFFRPQPPSFAERLRTRPFRLRSAVSVDELTAARLDDPLARGARALLGIAAAVAAVLGLFGLLVAARSTLDAERTLLAEYEVMGVPRSTLVRSTQVRLLVLSLLGVAAGFGGGLLALRLVGAFVAVTGSAERPLVPIEAVVAWKGSALVLAGTAVAAAVLVTALAGRLVRESLGRRLRA